jgi:hypothetical protein
MVAEKIVWELPLKTCDETNAYEKPYMKTKRHKQQQFFIRLLFNNENKPVPLPCSITFVRLGPRFMDEEDNLRMAFKWIKDQAGACIFPEKSVIYITKQGKVRENMGHADSDPRIKWNYKQEKSSRLGIRIEIEPI